MDTTGNVYFNQNQCSSVSQLFSFWGTPCTNSCEIKKNLNKGEKVKQETASSLIMCECTSKVTGLTTNNYLSK
jgi:hypothetical protein